MRLVTFSVADHGAAPGLLTDRGVIDLSDLASSMVEVIDRFDELSSSIGRLAGATPVENVRLLAPLPRPGKILCATGGSGQPLLMTLKSAESVIGPGQTIQLPDVSAEGHFLPEAELGLVTRG